MGLQSVCGSCSSRRFALFNFEYESSQYLSPKNGTRTGQVCRLPNCSPKTSATGLRWSLSNGSSAHKLRKSTTTHASDADSNSPVTQNAYTGVQKLPNLVFEPFRGKPGSVSFHGLTYQALEERNLISSPFNREDGSFLWLVAPAALISSLLLPPPFITNVFDAIIKNDALAELMVSLSTDAFFYAGVAAFLVIADRIQKPYLQFSAKSWSLITGLNGYFTASYIVAGLKILALIVALSAWPELGLQSLVPLVPIFVSSMAQVAFEFFVDGRNSSCWPLVPIIFEVYRIYQLSKASGYIQRLMFEVQNLPVTPELGPKRDALVALFVTAKLLAVVCLWSLLTFLLRLFPSRPVRENY